jgi:hypothetical protein
MAFALYIDESGDFKETGLSQTGRSSIVGGWIAKTDQDHEMLRQQLNEWYHTMSGLLEEKAFHATVWRRHAQGRLFLDQVFALTNDLKAYSIVFMENRSANLAEHADSTYLDMLVELIVTTLFHLMETRRHTQAFPLQVYVAERKGIPDWEIRKLVQYRLRTLLNGSRFHHMIDPGTTCDIHVKALNKRPDLINTAQSRSRDKMGLMPEMILADFLCNCLYQMDHFRDKPEDLTTCAWHPLIYIPDPFWNDIQTYKNQKRWIELLTTLTSPRAKEWISQNQAMSHLFNELLNETISHVVSNLAAVQQLNALVSTMIHHTRQFTHAGSILDVIETHPEKIAPHLAQTLTWHHTIFKLSIANHLGDNKAAGTCFDAFTSLLGDPLYQRTEFFQTVADHYNRHAVALTDRYAFEQADQVLQSAISAEKTILNTRFDIQNQTFQAQKSDTLGKILSTLGQVYTKQAYRTPEKAIQALDCFEQAERHMQQSLDPERQNNYRIEAWLTSRRPESADHIHNLLTRNGDMAPETLFSQTGYASFNTLYWLRWMFLSNNKPAAPYRKTVIKHHLPGFLDLDGNRYPQMSILYYVGQLAWAYNKKTAAITAWNKAAAPGRQFTYAGVLQTLALRPLCELILNSRADDAAQSENTVSLKKIIARIRTDGVINPDYFETYFPILEKAYIPGDVLKQLQQDIPYS